MLFKYAAVKYSGIRRISLKVEKDVNDAYKYRKGNKEIKVYRKGLYKALTNLGNKNFINYAKRAGDDVFESDTIKKQYKGSVKKVEKVLKKKMSKHESNNMPKDPQSVDDSAKQNL